jgi:hypothetical protein
MKKLIIVALLISVGVLAASCKEHKAAGENVEETPSEVEHKKDELVSQDVFQCPMDCEKGKIYDDKGNCPVCKMSLKKKEHVEEHDEEPQENEEYDEKEEHKEKDDHS